MGHLRQPSRTVHRLAALITAAVIATWVASAVALGSGSVLYASASSTTTSGCTSSSTPCSLTGAISAAAAGDIVIVLPGTYSLSSGLLISSAITVEGQAGQPRPQLIGATTLASDTVAASGGAVLQHLDIETTTTVALAQASALTLDGATGIDLTLSAASSDSQGEALSMKDSSAGTVARTILAVSAAPDGDAVSFKDGATPGTATLDHVTAVGTSSTTDAISGNVVSGTITITNAIASSPHFDVSTKSGTHPLGISDSDFVTTSSSSAVASGVTGNVNTAPVFANASGGNYQEGAASPSIGAGVAQPNQTESDLNGTTWASPPDMGAYQYVAGGSGTSSSTSSSSSSSSSSSPSSSSSATVTSTTSTATSSSSTTATSTTSTATSVPSGSHGSNDSQGSQGSDGGGEPTAVTSDATPLPAPSAPVAGVSVTLRPASGTVTVALPGGSFVPLGQAAQLPVGSVIDATDGTVTLTSAITRTGATKTGSFTGGEFTVTQTGGAHPATDLRLVGGSFTTTCSMPTVAPQLIIAGAGPFRPFVRAGRRPSHKVVRLLWGSDHHGHFVTIGRSASAAVRGTVWLTEDRCDGTLIAVRRGRVIVHAAGRAVLVSAGHSYLAHARS